MNLIVNDRGIKKIENRYYDVINNELYLLLFYHDSTIETYWSNNEYKYIETNGKYSILGNLTNQFQINHNYQFLLDYPNFSPIIWKQTNTPSNENIDGSNTSVSGFKPIAVDSNAFTGLSLASSSCLYDGTSQTGRWHYCIGIRASSYDPPNIIPGPYGQFVSKVALWVKFPVQPRFTIQFVTNNKIYVYVFIYLIVK